MAGGGPDAWRGRSKALAERGRSCLVHQQTGGIITDATGNRTDQILISVVIPARDAEATIGAQLAALARQDFNGTWEVVVVDNGSEDGTARVVESYRDRLPHLSIVQAGHRQGINVARNAGAAQARGTILLFCDADDEVQPRWLEHMAVVMADADAAAGLLDLKLLNDARHWPSHLHRNTARATPPSVLGFLPYPIGANCAVRREIWESLEGFDESFVYGGEEVEFFWRLQLAGYQLSHAPAATVNYRLPSSTRAAMRRGFAKGRAAALLYHRFAEHGARFRVLVALRSWVGLVGRSYRLLGRPVTRHSWLLRAAQQCGRVAGGIQHRRLFF